MTRSDDDGRLADYEHEQEGLAVSDWLDGRGARAKVGWAREVRELETMSEGGAMLSFPMRYEVVTGHLLLKSVPPLLVEGIARYLVFRCVPGSYLAAVLSNDLLEAFRRGDRAAIDALPSIMRFLYDEVPSVAFGSLAAYERWLSGYRPELSAA